MVQNSAERVQMSRQFLRHIASNRSCLDDNLCPIRICTFSAFLAVYWSVRFWLIFSCLSILTDFSLPSLANFHSWQKEHFARLVWLFLLAVILDSPRGEVETSQLRRCLSMKVPKEFDDSCLSKGHVSLPNSRQLLFHIDVRTYRTIFEFFFYFSTLCFHV